MNDYFCTIGTRIQHENSAPNQTNHEATSNMTKNLNSMAWYNCTPPEIYGIINKMKICGPGWDGLHPKILKSCAGELAPILSHLINLSVLNGKVPLELKISLVTPIHKGGDKTSVNNFRPISVLPFFAKVYESNSPILRI